MTNDLPALEFLTSFHSHLWFFGSATRFVPGVCTSRRLVVTDDFGPTSVFLSSAILSFKFLTPAFRLAPPDIQPKARRPYTIVASEEAALDAERAPIITPTSLLPI